MIRPGCLFCFPAVACVNVKMTTGKPNFIVVDDNKVDCFIAENIIKNSGKSGNCLVFYQAANALEYIKNLRVQTVRTIVFVDIQMPVMNGFEFVEAFERLPCEIKSLYYLYLLSSSIHEHDITRAGSYLSVRKFISKPLTIDIISDLINDLAK